MGPVGYRRGVPLSPSTPDLVSLDLFCSVVELGSLGRAAAAHGISQPSASARIRGLERRLGVRVLERGPNGSRPTDDGVLLADWARAVLAAAQQLTDGVEALGRGGPATVRIAASNTVAEFLLPGWLVEWRRTEPARGRIGVEVEVTNSVGVLDSVEEGAVALGFIESPGPLDGRFDSRRLRDDELVVVVAPSHRWVRRAASPSAASLSPAELADEPLVTRELGSGTREAFDAALAAAGHAAVAPVLELGSTTAVLGAVGRGAGPAVVSVLAVEHELAAERLVSVPVVGLDLRRPLRAVWRSTQQPDPAAAALVAFAAR